MFIKIRKQYVSGHAAVAGKHRRALQLGEHLAFPVIRRDQRLLSAPARTPSSRKT